MTDGGTPAALYQEGSANWSLAPPPVAPPPPELSFQTVSEVIVVPLAVRWLPPQVGELAPEAGKS